MAIQSNFPAIKPSLLLDFANTKQLDPRITFTRASTATYYDGVTTAMAEQNLLTLSEQFDNAAWNLTSGAVTAVANATTSPDGNSTADLIYPTSTGVMRYVYQARAVSGTQYTVSVYAKASGLNWLCIYKSSGTGGAWFNLSTGVVGTISSGVTASITSVGNSWYRCSITYTAIDIYFLFGGVDADNSITATTSGTNGIYLWGAQAEQRSAVSAYTATTTQAITNYIPVLQTAASGVARFDNNPTTGESLGLLIEESRTNLLTYSSQFDNAAYVKTNMTITADTVVAPDGTLTGDKFVENTTASVAHSFYQAVASQPASTYTYTVYVKSAGRTQLRFAQVFTTAYQVDFDLTTLVISNSSGGATGTITSVGNGWYRCSMTFTTVASLTLGMAIYSISGGSVTYTGDGFSGLYLWGAQLETGAFPTSYIPTVASTVTRAADAASMTGTNFSSWFNNGEGTIYADFTRLTLVSSSQFSISDGTNTNYIQSVSSGTGAFEQAIISTNGTIVFNYGPTAVLSGKIVMAYKFNDSAASLNAATATTDTSVTIPAVNQLSIANSTTNNRLNGTIKKLAYYPIRVTNTQLQALTS